jgi:hypothetical protein
MRKIHTIITLVTVGTSSAQLTDPGFEQYGVNWDHWCAWEFVNDVPPGGGNVSLRLPLVTGISPDCFVEEGLQPLAYQATPTVQGGDQVTIDLWVKATPDDPNDAPWMNMVLFFGWLTSPTTFDHDPVVPIWYPATGEWTLVTITQPVGDVPVGSTPVLFIGGHGFNQSPGFIQFDDVTLDVSTRIEEQPASPRSGIDAVTGNWWLETTETAAVPYRAGCHGPQRAGLLATNRPNTCRCAFEHAHRWRLHGADQLSQRPANVPVR